MAKTSDLFAERLSVVPFSDGYDNGFVWGSDDFEAFFSSVNTHGPKAVADLIKAKAKDGHPFKHVIYTPLLAWVGRVANEHQIPSTLFWTQAAAIWDIYYYYFKGFGEKIAKRRSSDTIELPGLPLLAGSDLPSFLKPSSPGVHNFGLKAVKEHIEVLEKQENPKILVNSFEGLEFESLKAIEMFKMIAIGPLIPSAFLDGSDPSDSSFGGDFIENSRGYVEWLNSKAEGSLVYVAFGSITELPQEQMEEIAHGLLESNKSFLWVIRTSPNGEKLEEKLSCKDQLEKLGLIVPWCSQVEVLSHTSVGCFVTHCGWNSYLESLVSGVPVVAIPLWTDQNTNAKFVQDIWRTGVRAKANENGIVEADEIRSSLEIVMDQGERGQEMRKNAKKWKDLARDAAKEEGSSNLNLKAFVKEVGQGVTKT